MNSVYMDNNATTSLKKEVLDALVDVELNYYGNYNSSHKLGIKSKEKYNELNIMLLSKAKSYLDWITLVHLYYEQTMESLATWKVLQKEDIINW